METFVDVATVGKIIMRFFNEVRVFRCDDSTVKHAIADGTVHKTFLVAENLSLINMARVYQPLALASVFSVMDLQAETSD